MPRLMLTDESWDRLSELMKHTGRVDDEVEQRMTLEGILYRMRAGCPRRDLPGEFGSWNSVFRLLNVPLDVNNIDYAVSVVLTMAVGRAMPVRLG